MRDPRRRNRYTTIKAITSAMVMTQIPATTAPMIISILLQQRQQQRN
jgi:hypothetical protein